ncbi:hypothetical protein [Microbacterium sp.]|uniref:hypothetical protein n=1 Tax=Microbacterium sp. TaxID=51671 RepID=UPI0028AB0CD4|nr:hypothetical protein [Microbacterium sp.]
MQFENFFIPKKKRSRKMSVSIYYSCELGDYLTDEQVFSVNNIIDKYNKDFPFEISSEDFGFYTKIECNKKIEGSTKLPSEEDYILDVLFYWLECLTELRQIIPNDSWSVNLDDTTLEWNSSEGWELPL